mgnify:CR=1 FL=1
MNVLNNVEGGISKVKLGAWLVGLSAVLGTVAGYLNGSLDMFTALQALATEVGAVFAALGLRDIPFLNSAK